MIELRRHDSRLVRQKEIELEEFNQKQMSKHSGIEREAFAQVMVMPPQKSPFDLVEGESDILMKEWHRNKDYKKLEVSGEHLNLI